MRVRWTFILKDGDEASATTPMGLSTEQAMAAAGINFRDVQTFTKTVIR